MSFGDEHLILGRGYPHDGTAACSFSTTAAQYAATNSTKYNATPGSNTALFNGVCRFVEVCNDDPTNFLSVSIGNSVVAPTAATAGFSKVYPRTSRFFQLEEGGNAILNIKADTATVSGSVIYYK